MTLSIFFEVEPHQPVRSHYGRKTHVDGGKTRSARRRTSGWTAYGNCRGQPGNDAAAPTRTDGPERPDAIAAEVRKRLTQIARSRSFADWRKVRELASDLEGQRKAIVDQVAKVDAAEALDLMWRLMELARPVYERCDDSNGVVGDVFRTGCADLGPLAQAAKPDPVGLADRVFAACCENEYGQYDRLIETLASTLGADGLAHLKRRFVEFSKTQVERPPPEKRKAIGWSSSGPIYQDEIETTGREMTVRLALRQIADAQGDVDAFIAQYDKKARAVPRVAAEIAQRLLTAGRPEEALEKLDAADHGRSGWPDFDWEDARIDALETLGRIDDAQAARWACFERSLSQEHLRAYLKHLPDFEDVEAEHRALDHAEQFQGVLQALAFMISWPALDRAARIVTRRATELDGNYFELLTPAADALAAKYPLAATLALRAMIDFTLSKARSSRYRHAARHLTECASLVATITDFGEFETHAVYVARLRSEHPRKTGFWSQIV